MKKVLTTVAASAALLMFLSACSCACFYKEITLVNRTNGPLSLQVLDKPLRRSDVPSLEFYRLDNYEKMRLEARTRIIGWYQPGEPTGNTVLTYEDDVIVFIKHDGVIKTLHGPLRSFVLENPYDFSVVARIKNIHANAIDCNDCWATCTSANRCPCLDICHDTTEDMEWHLAPYEQRQAYVASGTKIGLYGNDEQEIIIKRTRYYY